MLASGQACLRVREHISPGDIHAVGTRLQVDSTFCSCHDWKLERDGQTRPLIEVLSELADVDREAVGPGRAWILAVIEDRPFLWAELVDEIEQFVAARVGEAPGWWRRLRAALRRT
ncbi:hypothetical protein [Nannocystis pusilla]|uniref:hypothetical protein n=1 Tax=Nannocystis pusilla TaxID=889268 RepID=UPI003DA501C7